MVEGGKFYTTAKALRRPKAAFCLTNLDKSCRIFLRDLRGDHHEVFQN